MNAPPEIKKTKEEAPAELESQIILRLPGQAAAALRAAVRSGVMNLKDRLTIQLEPDNRHGTVRFDRWTLSARVVDLPSIIESHKTLDRKTFYKTADVAQLMICKEEDGTEEEEAKKAAAAEDEEALRRKERKDAKDKKYQYPHGITPSLKNVRKRRFRKVLKKKYVDFPEIEKEVKRLFRTDNEAVSIRYEVVNADDDKGGDGKGDGTEVTNGGSGEPHVGGGFGSPSVSALLNSNSQSMDVGEHDLFGEALSSSDEDDVNIVDSGGEEDLLPRPPKQRHPLSSGKQDGGSSPDMVTDFRRGMLAATDKMASSASVAATAAATSSLVEEYVDDPDYGEDKEVIDFATKKQGDDDADEPEQDNSALLNRLSELEREIAQLQERRQAQELEIASIENQALKQRFQNIVNTLKIEESDKQREYDEIVSRLHQ